MLRRDNCGWFYIVTSRFSYHYFDLLDRRNMEVAEVLYYAFIYHIYL
jgi:hypothetical protein